MCCCKFGFKMISDKKYVYLIKLYLLYNTNEAKHNKNLRMFKSYLHNLDINFWPNYKTT